MICPKCGMEFVDGVTHCSDCHVPLVTPSEVKKEMIPFMEGSVTTMQRLTDFLIYSGIDAKMEETDITDTNMAEDTENMNPVNICVLWIPKEEEKQAQKLATVFFHEEEKRNPMSISQESIKDMKSNKATASKEEQGTYILGKDRHADSISTFWMLAAAALVCTGISLNNTITNFSKIISLEYNSYVPFVVFWIISILLIWGTLKYYKITKDLK